MPRHACVSASTSRVSTSRLRRLTVLLTWGLFFPTILSSSGESSSSGCAIGLGRSVGRGGGVGTWTTTGPRSGSRTKWWYLRDREMIPVRYVVYIDSVTTLISASGTPRRRRYGLNADGNTPRERRLLSNCERGSWAIRIASGNIVTLTGALGAREETRAALRALR